VIFVHYTAGPEGPAAAEEGARYDQRRTDGTSAHYYADQNSVVQCVDTDDRSHTALYRANLIGLHYELCGTAQSRAQWLDAASRPTIRNASRIMALDMEHYGIPLRRLVNRQVRTGRGIAGHGDATRGFPEDHGTHLDPDGNRPGSFPWDVLLDDIHSFLRGSPVPETPEERLARQLRELDQRVEELDTLRARQLNALGARTSKLEELDILRARQLNELGGRTSKLEELDVDRAKQLTALTERVAALEAKP
jgi:hypothetical protein